jgi:hypothetical protein
LALFILIAVFEVAAAVRAAQDLRSELLVAVFAVARVNHRPDCLPFTLRGREGRPPVRP